MSQQVITVRIPETIYERVKRTAQGMRQPVEQTLVSIVQAAMPSLEKVPPEYHPELEAMETLSDEDLWHVAESQVSAPRQRQLNRLLQKNQAGTLTKRERQVLTELRTELDRLMLRRSYAYLLLKCRGHRIPTLTELRQ
jgi:hypothetical protein